MTLLRLQDIDFEYDNFGINKKANIHIFLITFMLHLPYSIPLASQGLMQYKTQHQIMHDFHHSSESNTSFGWITQ